MVKISSSLILRGILWGALFFCPYAISAQDATARDDSELKQDSIPFVKERIKNWKRLRADTASKDMEDSQLITKDSLIILNDTIYVQNDTLTTQKDTVLILNDSVSILNKGSIFKKKNVREHSPPRATILSAVIPGLGQAYNRKYWKIPIIYAAGTGLYLYFDYANGIFNKYKNIYETEFAKGPERDQNVMDNAALNRDVWSKRRGYTVIFMGLLYVANVVDAMVDAYFISFDVSDDLSMRIEPNLDQIPSQYAFDNFSYGVKISLNF